jgi:hypothetical protein
VAGAVCNTLSGAAGNIASAGAGDAIGTVLSAAARWVASGAVWLIAQVGRAMSSTTSVDLSAGWFTAHEAVMASLAAAVVLPMACCAAIQAVYRQSASMLLRTFFVHLPLSLLLTGVAVTLVRMALAATDAMSAAVLASAGVDTTNLFTGLFKFLIPAAVVPGVPGFVVLFGSFVVASAALALWLELVVRAAAVSVAVLFLPLALAALVWPSVAHWCRRLADTLVALVLSKLVVAAVLSLAASAIAGGLGVSSNGNGGGFASVVTGIALLLIAIVSPFTLLRLVPAVEAGAVAHLESSRHRVKSAAAAPIGKGRSLAMDHLKKAGGSAGDGDTFVGTGRATGSEGASALAAGMVTGSAAALSVFSQLGAEGSAAGGGSAAVADVGGTNGSVGAANRSTDEPDAHVGATGGGANSGPAPTGPAIPGNPPIQDVAATGRDDE